MPDEPSADCLVEAALRKPGTGIWEMTTDLPSHACVRDCHNSGRNKGAMQMSSGLWPPPVMGQRR